jgi:DNA repair protein RadC
MKVFFSAREIFKLAFDYNAASIILVHNHPSGDATPSNDDIFSTKDLIKAGNLIGIRINDHIIIGNNNFVSMREKFKTLFEE